MAQRRRGPALSAPRALTALASLLLVAAAVASPHVHLPWGHGFVAAHRFALAAGGYGLLFVGVLVPAL